MSSYSKNCSNDDVVEDEDISLDDLLCNKLDRITELELVISNKNKDISKLRESVVESDVKHKQEVYFLKLELETCRRENKAAEERVVEMYKELNNLIKQPETKTDDSESEAATEKYQQAIALCENQLQMVKSSHSETIKTMKAEILELMEDKSCMELDFLNQLSSLKAEKKDQETLFLQRLEEKEVAIEIMRKRGSDGQSVYSLDIEGMENEISSLLLEKQNLKDAFTKEQEQADEEIHYLLQSNTILEQKIDALKIDIAVLRSGNSGQRTKYTIAKEKEEIAMFMNKVMFMNKSTEESMKKLEELHHSIRASSTEDLDKNSLHLLTTLESASLVYAQTKVSVQLLELKLENQLQSLQLEVSENGLLTQNTSTISRIREVKNNTLEAMAQLEETLSQEILHVKEKALGEVKQIKEILENQAYAWKVLHHDDCKDCEKETGELKQQESSSDGEASESQSICVRREIIDQLQVEVLAVVEKMKQKDEAIKALIVQLHHQKNREKDLLRELRQAQKAVKYGKSLRKTSNSTESVTTSPSTSNSILLKPLPPSPREVFPPQIEKKQDISI